MEARPPDIAAGAPLPQAPPGGPGRGAGAASPAFLAGFVVANLGAFASFLPLLQILLPLKAARIAPGDAATLLSQAAAAGALAAGAANIGVGWLSDRTRPRVGRRPWIIGGAAATALSYALVWKAQSWGGLIGAIVVFQIAFNALFAPLLALIPDRVPRTGRGWASAMFALGFPLGSAAGGLVVGTLLADEAQRYGALALMVLVTSIPFALRLTEGAPLAATGPSVAPGLEPRPRVALNFALGWVARACVIGAFSLAQTFLLFYLQTALGRSAPGSAERGVAVLGVLFGLACALAGLTCGRASDLSGRRRPLVIGAALAVAAGMAGMAVAPGWAAVLVAYGVYALGAGCHTAVDFAMMTELLPSRDRSARDLGVLNLSNIAPQIVAPLAAAAILRVPGADIRWVFAGAAASAVAGAGLVGLMRRVR